MQLGAISGSHPNGPARERPTKSESPPRDPPGDGTHKHAPSAKRKVTARSTDDERGKEDDEDRKPK